MKVVLNRIKTLDDIRRLMEMNWSVKADISYMNTINSFQMVIINFKCQSTIIFYFQ